MSLYVDITLHYDNFHLDIQFETAEQEILGLLGASGSGKSLTLQCIAGVIKPDAGRIVYKDRVLFDSKKRIHLPPQQRRIGYLFQNYALFPHMTVKQNIATGLSAIKNQKRKQILLEDMIRRLRLQGLEKHKPHQLSGGQQQRTAIARMLVSDPAILLLDEPFSALDSFLKDRLRVELQDILSKWQKPVLLVTHNRDEAYELCDTLAIMERGSLCEQGQTKELFDNPRTRTGALLTGCKNICAAKKAGRTTVYIPAWGIELDAGRTVGENLCAIGIRASHFSKDLTENRQAVQITGLREEPYRYLVEFRFLSQKADSRPVWYYTADKSKPSFTHIGIKPAHIHLLYA